MNSFIRPAWTPATIALMIIGFMVFWPLGLAMIAYIVWGDRLEAFKTEVNGATDKAVNAFGAGKFKGFTADRTGNVAFDDWREAELKRLHEERIRLDGMRAEFDDYARELRRAKDQEEFASFMSNRKETVDNAEAPKVVKSAKAKKAGTGKAATA
ncbi:MAG: DUF2852 domain-containing protein [Pseudomonadota bacterium]